MDCYVSSMCNENGYYVTILSYPNMNRKSYEMHLELNSVKHLNVPYICIGMYLNEKDPMEDYLPGHVDTYSIILLRLMHAYIYNTIHLYLP